MSTIMARGDFAKNGFRYYNYDPTMVGAIVFIALFLLSTLLHFFQMFRTRTWFMIPFCIGGCFEFIGYIGRAISHTQTPDWSLGPYVLQSTLLLVAPALLAASIYMELARIVQMVEGDAKLIVRRAWLTRIFVCGDIFSFLMQASGAGILATGAKNIKTGEYIIIAGLALQLIFFGLFVLAGFLFHIRMAKAPTPNSNRLPWKKHLWSMYIVSALIFARSLVRLIEYIQGWTGYIISHEIYLYVFDALLMFLAMATMNLIHPSEVAALIRGYGRRMRFLIFTKEVGSPKHTNPETRMGPWA